ncbi:polyprenyl synthetase family protein [Gemmata sp. JC673]|uniref:Polyprenyl synthetase family protein n=1 Tax=Gemmata algarum TaxID=2975278 RepID=A0ABU5F0U1_9BACT|nr:farnesyl diphosphate synthase [Gemmata algarum]MDY3560930.1 polyprenyl synthetase family protein [Gemmata algarum]
MTSGSDIGDTQTRLALQRKVDSIAAPAGGAGSTTDRLLDALKARQERVERALRDALGLVTREAPPALTEAMAYSLFSPGKRLRPLLVALACEAAGGALDAALPSACAVEMIHTYSLIHDDLPAMDDDDLRRGQPTCHKRFGEALAILAGDALLTGAFEVVCAGYAPRTAAVSCAELARGAGAVGMVGGQTLDLEAEGRVPAGPTALQGVERLEDIHRRKTGALFRSSLRLGVFAAQAERPAGACPEALKAADDYADAFGLAFQVTDDLLDVESTADKAGKRVGKDAARGKLTYPGLLGTEASRRRAAELGQLAVAAAERLGSEPLADLARYVVTREK